MLVQVRKHLNECVKGALLLVEDLVYDLLLCVAFTEKQFPKLLYLNNIQLLNI